MKATASSRRTPTTNDLSVLHGHPPKVIWLRLGNCSTETIFDSLRTCRAAIEEFGADPDESVLLIP